MADEKVLEEMPMDGDMLMDLEDIAEDSKSESEDGLVDFGALEEFKEEPPKEAEEEQGGILEEMTEDIPKEEVPDEEIPVEEAEEESEDESEKESEEVEEESEEGEEESEEEVEEQEEVATEEDVSENDAGTAEELLAFHSDYTLKTLPIENIKVINEKPFFNRTAESPVVPVVYKDKDGNYILIAGGLMNCRVVEADDDLARLYRTDYRLKRLELSEKEKDDAIADEVAIYQNYGSDFDEASQNVADLNFIDKDEVKSKVLVRQLVPELKDKVEKGISPKQAELLLTLNKTQQKTVAETMEQLNLNVITTEEAQELARLAKDKELTKPNARITLDHDSVFISKKELNDLILRLTTSAVKEIEDRGAITVEE